MCPCGNYVADAYPQVHTCAILWVWFDEEKVENGYPSINMKIICRVCGRDIDAIGQDNMSTGGAPICEDCAGE